MQSGGNDPDAFEALFKALSLLALLRFQSSHLARHKPFDPG
jgi:hypothetical protein